MDTSHVKQVAAFEKLVGFCNAQGAMFNPSKPALQSAALNALLTSAHESVEAVRTARNNYTQSVNTRNDVFDSLPRLITRMFNALAATDASPSVLADARRIAKKFKRQYKKPTEAVPEGTNAAPTSESKTISHLDFESRTENFKLMVKLLASEPSYQPNELDLQVNTLIAKGQELQNLNSAMISAQVALSNSRKIRNEALFDNKGIHTVAMATKRYIKAAFGAESAAYVQVRGLRFINQSR